MAEDPIVTNVLQHWFSMSGSGTTRCPNGTLTMYRYVKFDARYEISRV